MEGSFPKAIRTVRGFVGKTRALRAELLDCYLGLQDFYLTQRVHVAIWDILGP